MTDTEPRERESTETVTPGGGVSADPGAVTALSVAEPRSVEPQAVLALQSQCYTLDAAARQLDVGPDGHAWLVLGGDETALQVIDPVTGLTPATTWELPAIERINAWSASEASFSTSNGLWRVQNGERIEVVAPHAEQGGSFCGDFSDRAALVADGELYEIRGEEWWRYSSPADAPDTPVEVVRFDGACTDLNEAHWLAGDAGVIWRVGRNSASAPIQIEGATTIGGTHGFLGVATETQVWTGSVEEGVQNWQPWDLPGGVGPDALRLAGGAAWVSAGSSLYRFDGEEWFEASESIGVDTQMAAYANGIWTLDGDQACHYSLGAPIQVEGLRPFAQTRDEAIDVNIRVATQPVVEVNGEAIDVVSEDSSYQATVRLAEVGWSEVSIVAGASERSIWVKRIPLELRSWETDIRPVYEFNCTGSGCHDDGSAEEGPPDLGSFEAWLEYSFEIENRVLEGETMPPASSRAPEWGENQKTLIAEWLEGGLLP